MTKQVLVTYATRYGSTEEVASQIAETLRKNGLVVAIQPLREVKSLVDYKSVVLGTALYMFRLHKDTHHFLTRNREALMKLPTAVFVLGPTHEPHDPQEWQNSRMQMEKELAKYPWFKPVALEMFGGKYDPTSLHFPLNLMAGQEPASDIRNWETIHSWSNSLLEKLS